MSVFIYYIWRYVIFTYQNNRYLFDVLHNKYLSLTLKQFSIQLSKAEGEKSLPVALFIINRGTKQ